MAWVYVIDCLLSDSRYVGITTQNLEDRFSGHLREARKGSDRVICRAIRKYGPDAFYISPILEVDTWEEACAAEAEWIKALGTKAPKGYNLTDGGEGTPGVECSEETRRKKSESHKGLKHSEEAKRKIGDAHKGRVFSEETKAKMSAARKGKKLPDETRARMSAAKTGVRKIFSDEAKVRMGAGQKARWQRWREEKAALESEELDRSAGLSV